MDDICSLEQRIKEQLEWSDLLSILVFVKVDRNVPEKNNSGEMLVG